MTPTQQLRSKVQSTSHTNHKSGKLSKIRTSVSGVENEPPLSRIGGRVDGLIAALQTGRRSSEVFDYQPCRENKWEAFHQVEADRHFNSKPDGVMNDNFLQFLLTDCRQFLSPSTFAQKLQSLQAKLGIYEGEDSPNNLPTLLTQIPNLKEAIQCLEYYRESCEWIHRLLHWPSFHAKVSQILSRNHRLSSFSPADIHWLGLLFAACGLGLWTSALVNRDHHEDLDLPIGSQARQELALRWLRCATSALVIGQYDQDPSLDSLRTMSLLLCFPLYLSDKPSMEGAMDLTTETINLARQLNLDVDPDDLPCCKTSTEVAKDERRRFMVAILCQEFQLGGLFCKKAYLEPPSRFALKMPSKLYDEANEPNNNLRPIAATHDEIHIKPIQDQPTDMNGVISRYRVGQIWQSIGISFWEYQGPPSHQLVLELDQQLMNVEQDFPPGLKTSFESEHCRLYPPPMGETIVDMDRLSTYVLLASAHIRLHRPFVIPRHGISKTYHDWHRKRILYYGRLVLTVNENSHLPLLKHVSMNFFVLAASIALAVLLITSTGKESVTSLRRQVYQVHRTYQASTHNQNSTWNRGCHLLGVLVETDKARLLNPHFRINLAMLEKLLH